MPTDDRVGRKQRVDFFEHLAVQELAFGRQSLPLVVLQQDAFLTGFLPEHLIFGTQVLDHELLLAIDPTGQNEGIELPRM